MKLTVTFSLDNAAFEDENGPVEAARVLREAAEEVSMQNNLAPGITRLWDINGNRIGFLSVED